MFKGWKVRKIMKNGIISKLRKDYRDSFWAVERSNEGKNNFRMI
jgi:hypothetical protein